ncbi:MAG: hypothetical protein U0998_00080, partial [Moraxellaceae bacterium]|nr:hypothetical protein [Moraxellaceae bacterium]
MTQDNSAKASVISWINLFAELVRKRDFDAAKKLFSDHVHSFGTRTQEAVNLEELVTEQWQPTWLRTVFVNKDVAFIDYAALANDGFSAHNSFGGFSQTSSALSQFRVGPDHR